MKALDIVRTPKGSIALVSETVGQGTRISIKFIGCDHGEKNAWWDASALEFLDSLPRVLANATAHPMGSGLADVERSFPREQPR